MYLDQVPVEIVLEIFSYLGMHDVLAFHQVSKRYDTLLQENDSEVYRGIAIYHAIADPGATSIEDCLSRRCRKFDWIAGRGVNSWKSYGKGSLIVHGLY
jgi:F-box domain